MACPLIICLQKRLYWGYSTDGCKTGKVLISFELKSVQNANNIDDVDKADSFFDSIQKEKHYLETKFDGKINKQKIAIPSLENDDGKPHQELIVKNEDKNKHDNNISESDHSFVTVADILKKDETSYSVSKDHNRVAKDTELKSYKKDIIPKDELKGLITSFQEAVGGYFYAAEKDSEESILWCFLPKLKNHAFFLWIKTKQNHMLLQNWSVISDLLFIIFRRLDSIVCCSYGFYNISSSNKTFQVTMDNLF